MNLHFVEIVSAFIVLFAVIDILGSVPIILDIKKKGTKFSPFKATSISFLILILFLFIGEALLGLFNVDISSFAIAGSFVLMIMAFEMILGIEIFKHDTGSYKDYPYHLDKGLYNVKLIKNESGYS